jgi:CBS domain-containing protein
MQGATFSDCMGGHADVERAAVLGCRVTINPEVLGNLVGILSERDIVRTIADVGSAVLQVPVAQVMTRNVSTCDVNDSISSLMERMTNGKFRHMPVLDNDRLVGLVSIGDVLKSHIDTQYERVRNLEELIAELQMMRI